MGMIQTFKDLTIKGFDVDEGIRLCGDDEEIYMEVLWAAMEEGKQKIPLSAAFTKRRILSAIALRFMD